MADSIRPDGKPDLRFQRGHRVMFDPQLHQEAWLCARVMKRLTPLHQRWVRYLAEAFLVYQAEDAMEAADRADESEHTH